MATTTGCFDGAQNAVGDDKAVREEAEAEAEAPAEAEAGAGEVPTVDAEAGDAIDMGVADAAGENIIESALLFPLDEGDMDGVVAFGTSTWGVQGRISILMVGTEKVEEKGKENEVRGKERKNCNKVVGLCSFRPSVVGWTLDDFGMTWGKVGRV
eukprot:TRINITY_DN37465_c0_g1_i1.p2 TRINITY_DN37465_c0_g1~~TRINITY_DN37465_c0_g1_i1.p2  ORF type:complete len:155 (-),score=27.04 TRINITY_DN37465_c0_g1_i1:35-499(-)